MTKEVVGPAGKFGARYGKKIRTRFIEIDKRQRAKKKCPSCLHFGIKRVAAGIYECRKCSLKFGSDAYVMEG